MPRCSLMLMLMAGAALSACTVGPDYRRPAVVTPPAFKEAQGWVPASPADGVDKGAWWSAFNDPVLDGLEQKVEISNQTLAAAEAAYREARAMVAADRAQWFPVVAASGAATHSGGGTAAGTAATSATVPGTVIGGGTPNQFQIGVAASWAPDIWGQVRRTVEGARANAQASAALIANTRLIAQGELATEYVQLRLIDAEKELLAQAVTADRESLDVTQNKFKVGMAAMSDVLTARTQLATAQATLTDLDRQRTQAEHAIAVLIGQPPSALAIAPIANWSPGPPPTPSAVPSSLLQRRPDVAASERSAAAANAQIGVKTAAYFPSLSLSASYGASSSTLGALFAGSSTLWSLGADVSETLLDFGARKAGVAEARAAYDMAVAQYRQTVLTAFQQVEDQLAAARVLQAEASMSAEAAMEATQNEGITLNEYKAGTVDYTTVAAAQIIALNGRLSLVIVQAERMAAAVDLIQALGGGWDATDLPSNSEVSRLSANPERNPRSARD
jgi:NodT family efflux transporter outer membrane factor (OMF) lipoprotein